MILIAFSGRCGSSRCTAPAENEDALARDTLPALLAAWSAAGAAPPQLVLLARSLELSSAGQFLGLARNVRRNVRLDGSDTGIDTLAFRHLDHRAIDEPGRGALEAAAAWLVEALRAP